LVVTIIVTVLYVGLVLRADNESEGGILSLITLLSRRSTTSSQAPTRVVRWLATLGIFGASLFLADSMITPAISVLSAVEGLRVVQPELEPLIIPITVVIIVLLFAVQRTGTAKVGRFFGPLLPLPGYMTLGTLPACARPASIRWMAPGTCAPSAGRRQSATLSPTTPERVSSPESASSTGNFASTRSPRTLSQTP
jgi:hypothetical protein